MAQLIAGYVLDGLRDLFDSDEKIKIDRLSQWLSFFHIQSSRDFETQNQKNYSSAIAVLINMLQRGIPTKLNFYALEKIVSASTFLSFSNNDNKTIDVVFDTKESSIKETILNSFHLIDKRIKTDELRNEYDQSYDSKAQASKAEFLFDTLPSALTDILKENGEFIYQLLAENRSLSAILEKSDFQRISKDSATELADFTIQLPYSKPGKPGAIAIELDKDLSEIQQERNRARDKALLKSNWYSTLRLNNKDFDGTDYYYKIKNYLFDILDTEYVKRCRKNYKTPLWEKSNTKEILSLTLMPFAIARIQRTILELLAKTNLFEKEKVRIAVVERDVPCAQVAIMDLTEQIKTLNHLLPDSFQIKLPIISLTIFATEAFKESRFREEPPILIDELNPDSNYDLLIDISMLQRSQSAALPKSAAKEIITLRSTHYPDQQRKIFTAPFINYKGLLDDENDHDRLKESLEYFLKSIFRKKKYSLGQLQILDRSLQRKSVVGLLQTSEGKSLTYQLSTFLQPGITLFVAPVKALIKDQVYGLLKYDIDSTFYLDPTVDEQQKEQELEKVVKGTIQFLFITPERLQRKQFRHFLQQLYQREVYFCYGVIDEIHCVSEWGHDFRTAYMGISKKISTLCKGKNTTVPLFGLTATASFDVLTDIKEEMSVKDNAIIRSEYVSRSELHYIIKSSEIEEKEFHDTHALRNQLGAHKQEDLIGLIEQIPKDLVKIQRYLPDNKSQQRLPTITPDTFHRSGEHAGLIFCPHKSGYYGVTDRYNINSIGVLRGCLDNLYLLGNMNAGFYIGYDGPSFSISEEVEAVSNQNQIDYLNDKSSLMIATTDFGIGINKKNIRYTVHINYPQSIESLVQQTGRAGRDGKLAISYILFNDQEFFLKNKNQRIEHDFEINRFSVMKSFKGIEKEMSAIQEIMQQIYLPGNVIQLEKQLENEFNRDIRLTVETKEDAPVLIIKEKDQPTNNAIIELDTFSSAPGDNTTTDFTETIVAYVIDFLKNIDVDKSILAWLENPVTKPGLEKKWATVAKGEFFELELYFDNNIFQIIKELATWLKDKVHKKFTTEFLLQLQKVALNGDLFIEEIETAYRKFTGNKTAEFDDIVKTEKSAEGAKFYLKTLYNKIRDKRDTEKVIYRLLSMGIIDDYTVNYKEEKFTLKGVKQSLSDYRRNLESYMLKYYSHKIVSRKLDRLEINSESSELVGYMTFLVTFIYDEIQKKREQAIYDMREACRKAIEHDDTTLWMKEYINLYFNSKYSRKDYNYINAGGETIPASLSDDTEKGKQYDLQWTWKYMNVVEEDSTGSQIENIKHLDGACKRLLRYQPDNYALLLLRAFTIYMLEYQSVDYLKEAEKMLRHAFESLQENEPQLTLTDTESILKKFIALVKRKNSELARTMNAFGITIDGTSIILTQYVKVLHKAKGFLKAINKKLNL